MLAHPLCIALYLKNTGCSAIDSVHPTVIAAAEGARRKLSKPVQPKQPLDLETVVKVAQYYNTALASLADTRFLFVFLVGYAGLFRTSKLWSVKIKDITIVHDDMLIFVSKRKNDQFREGHTSIIARSGKVSCLVSITERLLVLLGSPRESCSPVLRRIVCTKNGAFFHKSLGISYSTICDKFKKYVSLFVNDPGDYCLLSLKSGGTANDGYKLSDPELKGRHAGWKNPCTKRRYTKRSHAEMLEVTKSMGF